MKIICLKEDNTLIKKTQRFLFYMIKQEFKLDYVPEYHYDIINIKDVYIRPERNNFYIILNDNNDIIGSLGIRGYDKDFNEFKKRYTNENTASLWRVFIKKEYRRCGLASELVRIAEDFSKTMNYSEIYLHTQKTVKGSLEFWLAQNFNITIEEKGKLKTVHMEKSVNKTPETTITNENMNTTEVY